MIRGRWELCSCPTPSVSLGGNYRLASEKSQLVSRPRSQTSCSCTFRKIPVPCPLGPLTSSLRDELSEGRCGDISGAGPSHL